MSSLASTAIGLEDTLSRVLPYSSQVADGVTATKGGDLVCTWQIAGIPFEGLSAADAAEQLDALNLLVRGLSNGRFAFWVHRVRRRVADQLTLPPAGFARALMERYYRELCSGGLVATELFLSVVYRPQPPGRLGFLHRAARDAGEIRRGFESAIDVLMDLDRQIRSTLQAYGPRRLVDYERDGIRYAEQLEFFGFLANGHWWRVPAKQIPANRYLGTSRVLFGNELMETRDTYGRSYSVFVDIKDYADFTDAGILDPLIGLPFEYVETHSFSPYATPDAKAALELQRNQLSTSGDAARSQIAQMDQALDALTSGNFSFGEYHFSLQVKGSTPDQAKEARSRAIEALQSRGFLGVGVDLVVDHAYAAQLPGNWRHRPRTAKLSSRNFCGLCSLHNFGVGKREGNPWGEAVTILKSPADQPVYFNFHAGEPGVDAFGRPELGNTQIIGKSRSGKTVLALMLLGNLLKYGAQIVFFDKDRGAEIALRAMGGHYLVMERGKPTGLNPFKMEPTEANQLFWIDLVKFCSRLGDAAHTPKEEREIAHAVAALAMLPRALRGFTTLVQNLPNTDGNGVAARLQKWCVGGSHGWALDGDEDTLDFGVERICGLDYTEILDDATACGPLMMVLMYRVEQVIDGRRFAFFMDEYWRALQVSYFENFAKNKQKTISKQNGFGVYMTQSPSDTLASPIAKALIEQTATFVFLPNPGADRDEYIGGFKLTETEFELVRSLPEASRLFVVKQGHQVSVARLDLRGFGDELQLLSGTTANVQRLDRLRARLGDDPIHWMQPFLRGDS
jgi:type IV secretion system protein VirB4